MASVMDRARIWLARRLLKAMTLNIAPTWLQYSFMEATFRALVDEGYKANGAVFACVSALAFSFPEPRLMVWKQTDSGGREPLPQHQLNQVLTKPNPMMGIGEFLQFHIVYESIGGNCYWYKARAKGGKLLELWPLSDGQITIAYSPTKLIDHYELDNGSGTPENVPTEDIIQHRWMPDPLDPAHGLAPVMAVAREVDTDNEATRYLFTLLKNDAIPRVALKVPKETVLDDKGRIRLREDWMQKQGGENRGRVAVLEGGLDVTRIGLNLQELAFEALRRVPEARIAGAFRVPPIVAGLNIGLERSTYANFEEAARSFTLRTLAPLWSKVATQATSGLSEWLKPGEVVDFDLSTVAALAEAVQSKRQWVDGAVGRGYLMRNEARAALQLPRVKNGDVFLMPISTIVEAAEVESPKGDLRQVAGSKASPNRRAGATVARERQRIRGEWETRMSKDVNEYFDGLAERVVERARGKGGDAKETKDGPRGLPTVDQLLLGMDHDELGNLLKRYYASIIEASWEMWNTELGAVVAFDLTDPAVTAVLNQAGTRITQIDETTRDAIKELLKYGNEQGWSIDDLVRGDDTHPGIAAIAGGLSYIGPNGQFINLTPEQRGRMIARTELGWAQNQATTARYEDAGVAHVGVLDDGKEDDDEPCIVANGQTWTLKQADENPLEHPNCTRAFFAEFD